MLGELVTDSGLDALAAVLHESIVEKGFYDDYDMSKFKDQSCKIALVHSEATEVLEALRKEQGEYKVVEEIADVLIRSLDLYAALKNAGAVEASLDEVLEKKIEINKLRPKMHGVLG